MKPVGKQLQEARQAKNWTPELAARETKIKVDRLRDLEADDYSNFTSPTYARGFVRTYARALGLDEYKILRQLDNKLPDDDSANIVTDTGVAYLPETSLPPRAAHQDYSGLYIVMTLGAVVSLAIAFVLFKAYQVGEISRLFGTREEVVATDPVTSTNVAAAPVDSPAAPARALPADGSTPPPPVVETTNAPADTTNAVATAAQPPPDPATITSPKALPVDPAATGEPVTNATTVADNPPAAPRALPVDASTPTPDSTQSPADATTAAPRALPVNAAELAAMPHDAPPTNPAPTVVALNNAPPPDVPPVVTPNASSKFPNSERPSSSVPTMEPSLPPVSPTQDADPDPDKPLILTASQDSFVRVTNLDSADTDKPVYAAVLRSGQSIGFAGHKFSINVGVPSAVDIKLDGVNYGPHSDRSAPETFTVQSHVQ